MKKVIDKKMYDTDTASCVGEWSNGLGFNDFGHVTEELYRKKTGEFFLYGFGGPQTKYAENAGRNQWTSGERIMPLSYGEAEAWAEERLSADAYQDIFGEVREDESTTRMTITISAATADKLRRRASERGIGYSVLVEELITNGLNRE